MRYQSLDQIVEFCEKQKYAKKLAVVCAEDVHTLETVACAREKGMVEPILIGNAQVIREQLGGFSALEGCRIVPAGDCEQSVKVAIDLVKSGDAQAIMKGKLETSQLMRNIVHSESGICPSGIMSHLTILEIPNYHKLIGVTDGALVPYPDLDKKVQIILNSSQYLRRLGLEQVKVGVLAAVEKVNSKMPETVDAAALAELYRQGVFPGCIVEGPISYDLAVRDGAAALKGFESRVAGDVDLLVVPNITVGNVLIKALSCSAMAKAAGIIVGAVVPIVITSRSSSVQTKYQSVALAAAVKTI